MSESPYIPISQHEFRATVEERPEVATVTSPVTAETAPPKAGGFLILAFAVTLFVSATLLFLVQPMVGKMILPTLGGTPAVWNACMLFFQAALLGGYAYAHATASWLGVRRQAGIHLIIFAVPLLALPIAFGTGSRPPEASNPTLWLLGRLLLIVGLPFFAVSTTGPLLQKWFANTGHPAAKDPYFLYGASNAGSLLALLGYPLVLQPTLALVDQSLVWAWGYGLLFAMIGVCAVLIWRSPAPALRSTLLEAASKWQANQSSEQRAEPLTMGRRMWWVLAAFVPSSLMLGVTVHITSNLAPVPLLWILPLAIYLLTLVLVFASKPPIPHALPARVLPFLLLPLAVLVHMELPSMGWISILAHLFTFFVAAMLCHGVLARSRPTTRHLTEFYLLMAVGGVLGGIFNAIVAPGVFNSIVEYPLALVATCLLLPRPTASARTSRAATLDFVLPVVLIVAAAGLILGVRLAGWKDAYSIRALIFGPLAMFCFSFKDRPVRFALGLGIMFVALSYYCGAQRGTPLYAGRNFFGVKHVNVDSTGAFHMLVHGSTNHGMQFIDPSRSREPLAYYHRTGPLGDVFSVLDGPTERREVAIIGLGAGAVACYARPGEMFTFYEIDPEVERLARNPDYFTFLAECRGTCDVVLGDGRLTLADSPDEQFNLLILDAFSSDAIPTHLLTREALQIYLSKLSPDGLIAFHLSNRYLNLRPLVAALAADAGLVGLARSDVNLSAEDKADGKSPSRWVVVAREDRLLLSLAAKPEWERLEAPPGTPIWTDQHTSILSFMCWR